MENINLDDPEIYRQYDPENMLARIGELPWQCEQAWQAATAFNLPQGYAGIDKVIILGMGGSAIGGDLARSLAALEAKIPVIIHRDYGLPPYVDGRTLVIASSYSGNTEETLSGFEQALQTDARILAMTTGGQLKARADEKNIPVFLIEYKAQPRAALGFSFLPTLCFLQKLGFLADKTDDVAEAVRVMQTLAARIDTDSPMENNPAKRMARSLYGCLTVVYGAGILAEAAHRWKTQINENGKAWAFYEVFPELNHNATVGYPVPAEMIDKIRVVMLRSPLLNPRIQLRYQVTGELLEKAGVEHMSVDGEGKSALSQMMSLVLFGDYVSYYLAMLYQIDPSPVEVINYLKGKLAGG